MAINFSDQVYLPCYDTFARSVTVNPKVSQPGHASYVGRGIYNIEPIDVTTEEGSIFSDTRSILDILENEFSVLPLQGDEVTIPADSSGLKALGTFEIIETKPNGGGELTMILRKIVEAKP